VYELALETDVHDAVSDAAVFVVAARVGVVTVDNAMEEIVKVASDAYEIVGPSVATAPEQFT
jgi:hypothetical protein